MNTISQVFKYTQIFKRKENYQKPNQFDVNQDAGITEDLNRAKNQEKTELPPEQMGNEPPPPMQGNSLLIANC